MGFSTTVFLFLLALVATCHSSSPFNKLSNEENKILLEHCGLISPMTQRKIYGGTVVPETESVFTVKVVRDGKILSGVLVSPRHVITSINEEAATFDNRSCVGQNYHLSPIETSRIRVEVNSQSLTDLSASLEIKSAVLYFGCSLYPTIWIFELKEDVGDSKLHRPVCLVNKGIRMSNDSDVSIYSNGAVNGYEMGHRKTRIHLEKCPEKYQNERNLCGYGEAAVCQGDFGSGLVAQIDNRNYLAGVLTYKDSISDKLQCNGTVPGYKIPLVFISIEPLLDLICSEIGVCDASSNDGNNGGEITVITPKPIPACGGNQSETTVDNNNNDIKITVTAPEPLAIGTDIGKDVGTQTNDPSVLTVNIHINA